uniref:Predicted protein n=1 Tax=Hordeum vulgare subsp. vulgare TaxID=112509 RepID=F2DTY0_HORVV|nr:predicted protein [Hordeum vulgare subsp. vulgare]
MGALLRLLSIYLLVMITVPALFVLVHGDADITDQSTPTPDKILRSNEKVASKTDEEAVFREEEKINPDGLSVKELKQLEAKGEKHVFQAEVNKLMNILINSLYSNSEVFLRELISNASDALDKIRFLSLTDGEQLSSGSDLGIKIKVNKDEKTLTITDTGIGMSRDDLINNLGTIAKSGTTEFLKSFQASKDTNLIGQFGVGFYSAFLVADTVTVISKNNSDKQYIWQSDSHGSFSITEDPRGNTLGRGTSIVLHMKEEAEEFLDEKTLKDLLSKYSEFIDHPIYLWTSNVVDKEVALTDEEIAEEKRKAKEASKVEFEEDSETVSLDEADKEEEEEEFDFPKTKTVKETESTWSTMNEVKPLWTRGAKDVTDEEYKSFYKGAVAKGDYNDPIDWIHFNAEGEVDFKSLLYIPGTAPTNMYEQNKEGGHRGLRLYVRRVFITDEFRDILPKYLSFLKGIIDSDDLPLNVSREMLQESKTLKVIKKKIIRKAIAMFQKMCQDEDQTKYRQFWKLYGSTIKLGVIEDASNKQRLSELLVYQTSKSQEPSTLAKYVERMKDHQKNIYVLACEKIEECKQSPLAEQLHAKDFEVVYMVDPIDEYVMNSMDRYDGKYKFVNIAKEGLELEQTEEEKAAEEARKEEIKTEFAGLKDWFKQKFPTQIERVVVTTRLVSVPAALVSSSYGWTANMERIVKAQALGNPDAAAMNAPKKILEINPDHVLVKELNRRVKEDPEDQIALEMAEMLYETSAMTSGFPVTNPNKLVNQVLKMMTKSMQENLPQEVVEEVSKMETPKLHVVPETVPVTKKESATSTEETEKAEESEKAVEIEDHDEL